LLSKPHPKRIQFFIYLTAANYPSVHFHFPLRPCLVYKNFWVCANLTCQVLGPKPTIRQILHSAAHLPKNFGFAFNASHANRSMHMHMAQSKLYTINKQQNCYITQNCYNINTNPAHTLHSAIRSNVYNNESPLIVIKNALKYTHIKQNW